MDWKKIAIAKLEEYEPKRQSLQNIPMELAQIESTMTGIRSAKADSVAVKGSSGNARENMLINCIVKKEELQRNLEQAELWVKSVSAALGVLNLEERKILERMYMDQKKGAADDLAYELGLDRKTVYVRKDEALRKFTIALYGCVES